MRGKALSDDYITEGSILKGMLLFFLPIMCGTLLQQLYNTADAIIIGRALGKEALAAVGGSSGRITSLLVNFFVGVSSGAAVIVAQYFGAGNKPQLRRSIYTGVLLALASGCTVMILGLTLRVPLLTAMNTTADTIGLSAAYLGVYFLGMIPTILYNMGSGIMRAMGDSRRPLYYLIVCVAANVVFDMLFVLKFHWGVEGAAAATALSQVICAVLVLHALCRLPEEYRLRMERANFDPKALKRMLQIGLAAGTQGAMYSIANVVLQSAVNKLGTNSMAGWTAFNKIDDFYWPICGAIGTAVMTFVGQNYGAGKYDRMRRSIRVGMALHVSASLLASAILYTLRYQAIRLFVEGEPEVIEIGTQLMMICLAYALFSPTEVYSSAMRGVGNTLRPMLITVLSVCGLRLAYLWLYGFVHASNMVIAVIYPISWAAASTGFLLYYKFGDWMPKRKVE